MIYILLPVFNRKNITLKFVDCLLIQTCQDFRLILIDDGTDGTDLEVLKKLPETIVLKGTGNLWWAGALQKGYEWIIANETAHDDIILMINDDTTFDANFLETGFQLLSASEKTLFKAFGIDMDSGVWGDGLIYYNYKKLKSTETDDLEKANCTATRGLFIKAIDFFAIGGFIPGKLPHYLSDYEFTYRAHQMGYGLKTDKSLSLYADFKTTGMRSDKAIPIGRFFKTLFSNSNMMNPKHWISYVVLTTPEKRFVIRNVSLVLLWTLKRFFKSLLVWR